MNSKEKLLTLRFQETSFGINAEHDLLRVHHYLDPFSQMLWLPDAELRVHKYHSCRNADEVNVAPVFFARVQGDGEGDSLAIGVHEWPAKREFFVRCYKIDISSRFRFDVFDDFRLPE